MIGAAIIGGAGYTGGEAIRLLLNHPEAQLRFVQSTSNGGNLLSDVHSDLFGDTSMRFVAEPDWNGVDVVFLCVGHGDARKYMESHDIPAGVKIIDLSQDFRLAATSSIGERKFVYGLPEVNYDAIKSASNIANPGCFATCIELGLLPLAKEHLLKGDISVNAITGSTGAGVKPSATTHYSWRDNNISIYKPFEHQHVPEIMQSIKQLQPDFEGSIDFIPYRGCFPRGIFATLVVKCDLDIETLYKLYTAYYDRDSFTHVVERPLDLKQVVNTNKCLIHLEKHGDKLLITSVIDNLLKGASGTAVHNMNLLFGLAETVGLQLKPSAF
jgi:N-acetyl-gamma-glutamyl-phosphate reductase